MPSYIVGPRHCVVDGPLVDGIKVSACVQGAEVGPEVTVLVAVLWVLSEGEDSNVGCAHEVDPDGFEAVVWKNRVLARRGLV